MARAGSTPEVLAEGRFALQHRMECSSALWPNIYACRATKGVVARHVKAGTVLGHFKGRNVGNNIDIRSCIPVEYPVRTTPCLGDFRKTKIPRRSHQHPGRDVLPECNTITHEAPNVVYVTRSSVGRIHT